MAGQNDLKHAGRTIKARRVYIGKSQPDIERETNGALYVKLLSRLETGQKQLETLSFTKLRTLIAALEWTTEQFVQATGIQIDVELPNATPYNASFAVPVFPSVSAGLASTIDEDLVIGHYMLDPAVSGLRGRNMNNMRIMMVNGDSMASSELAQSIPDGSYVVVELGAVPRAGDIVVAWIDKLDTAVLKRFEEDDTAVLTSYNPAGPVFRASEYDMDIRGVVRMDFRRR